MLRHDGRSGAGLVALGVALLLGYGCSDASDPAADSGDFGAMEGATADCEFDSFSISLGADAPVMAHLNGLAVAELPGADKVSADAWEATRRRGVRFSTVFAAAGITAADDAPVNCIARDGFDPLRTRLGGDPSGLPTFAFLRDHGYIYVGSPGDKDPLYPEMEGKSLQVDFDLDSDAAVPAAFGGKLAGLGMFRWKMLEIVGDRGGLIEISPVLP